ncbi:TadE/TadG family type IV pilus assembly protein [Thalassiella azotivora]
MTPADGPRPVPRPPRAGHGSGGVPRPGDRGSAAVDFVLVGTLLTLMFVALVQLTLVLHVRNTLVDCAAEGARYGAFADRGPQDAAQRTRELIGASLSSRYAADVTATTVDLGGVDVVRVTVRAPLPVIGLLGPAGAIEVDGHGARRPA